MASIDSIDSMIEACATYGALVRSLVYNAGTVTAATVNSGGVTTTRLMTCNIPSMTSPVISAILTSIDGVSEDTTTTLVAGYVLQLGSLNMNTGTFTSGSTMPTRTIGGVSTQTASIYPFLVVTAAVTATTPTITITYTDQDGNTGQTATLVLPTSPALDTCFAIAPHLAAGDTGMRAVTNMTKSAGTAGTVEVYGFIPNAYGSSVSANYQMAQPLFNTLPFFPFKAGDQIGFFRMGSTSSTTGVITYTMIPETAF